MQAEQSAYLRHHSLADHLRNSRIDDALIHPDRLSEDIIRCISSIYCKFVPSNKGFSSTSSFCSSSTFSPGDLSGSWSPLCNDEVTENSDIESLKQDNGPSPTMVEVLKICLDDESYSYAATMLQKFRCLHLAAYNRKFYLSKPNFFLYCIMLFPTCFAREHERGL